MEMIHSDELRKELLSYIEYLLSKQKAESNKNVPVFGSAKGFFKMSENFDDPLDDFSEYMPK
jgi:hypothetical protein